MIPVRVRLRNFLCYGEAEDGVPHEFDFEGSRLWSISGDNGAGKSAIFDAITYTLFGRHRGGAQRDSRLIRKGAGECEAAFEFRLDGRLYRVSRTVGRPRGKAPAERKTWQAAFFDSDIEDWRTVPETERGDRLTKWVEAQLGFGYETFIASVMLLQGQSDQLILAEPKKRFDILSGILDLEPYKRLEQAAAARARDARTQAKLLDEQLAGMPVVMPEQLQQAERDLESFERALTAAQEAAGRAEVLYADAERHAGLQAHLQKARDALRDIDLLLAGSECIEAEFDEWRRLSEGLPKLRAALQDLAEAAGHARSADAAAEQANVIDLPLLAQEAQSAAKAEECAQGRVQDLRARHGALAAALPLLSDALRCRRELADREAALREGGAPPEWQTRAAQAQRALASLQAERDVAEAARRRALDAKSGAQAALRQAEEQLQSRQEAKDEAVCSRCGQPVSPEHIRRELADAQRAVDEACRLLPAATDALKQAEVRLKGVVERLNAATNELADARTSLAAARAAGEERFKASAALEKALRAASNAPQAEAIAREPLPQAARALAALRADVEDVASGLRQAEGDENDARAAARRAQQAHQEAASRARELLGEAARLRESAGALRRQARVRLEAVEPSWRERSLACDGAFVAALEQRCAALAGIDERHAALRQAVSQRDRLVAKAATAEQEIGRIPPQHRLPVMDAAEARERSQAGLREAQGRRDGAMRTLDDLRRARDQRQELDASRNQAQRRRALSDRLQDLLGRSGLQAHLMDAALEGIGHLANETLSRISGGQLQVRLGREPGSRGEDEITIQATDLAFSEEPLDAQFISGGQKFRTSVALAAGIGQYAGGGPGSVRSLIIDEGFGSLDSQGRQEMIDELQNLSQVMDRVIVVSHQEDFQDRTLFPTGYVLRKSGGRTVVERFV